MREFYTTLSDDDLIKRCEKLIEDFCKKGLESTEWSMSIPADPNRDPDLVFIELIERYKKRLENKNE